MTVRYGSDVLGRLVFGVDRERSAHHARLAVGLGIASFVLFTGFAWGPTERVLGSAFAWLSDLVVATGFVGYFGAYYVVLLAAALLPAAVAVHRNGGLAVAWLLVALPTAGYLLAVTVPWFLAGEAISSLAEFRVIIALPLVVGVVIGTLGFLIGMCGRGIASAAAGR